jgi:hypothetical protein
MPNTSVASSRPRSVLAATTCVALIFAIALYKWIFTAHWHEPIVSAIYFGFVFLFSLFVRALYRGKYWARNLTIWFGGISLLLFPLMWRDPRIDGLSIFQMALKVVAVVLLLIPSSRDWFSLSQRPLRSISKREDIIELLRLEICPYCYKGLSQVVHNDLWDVAICDGSKDTALRPTYSVACPHCSKSVRINRYGNIIK